MKKIIILLLSALSFMSFKLAPKVLTGVVVIGYVEAKSQNPLYLNSTMNPEQVSWDVSFLYSPDKYVVRMKDSTDCTINFANVYLKKQPSQSAGIPTNVLWVNPSDGLVKVSSINSIPLASSQVTAALGYTPLQTEVDGSITNEIQTLSISGQTISLSNGESVTIPTQTTALTASQVTTALGYSPSTSTLTSITASTGISITSGSVITNTIPDRTVAITGGTGITVTSSYPNFTVSPTAIVTHTASRAINSATFQVSSTLSAWVYYTIRINCVATIGGAASGTVALQYSTDSGSNWVDVGQVENSNTVTLAVVLNSNTTQTSQLCGFIPASAIVRMNQTVSGTTTVTFVRGQENY